MPGQATGPEWVSEQGEKQLLESEISLTNLAASSRDFSPRQVPLRDVSMPAQGELHIWYLRLHELALSLQAALDGPDGADPVDAFTSGQLRFARRFYLRLLLGAYLDIPGRSVRIIRSLRGKPVLDPARHGSRLHFSMAKSGDRLLIGLSRERELGVDLEPAGRRAHRPLGVARRYFSAAEAAALEAMRADRLNTAFLRTWACKEAVVKASGRGIANELCRFTVETEPDLPPAVLDFDGEPVTDWSLALLSPEPGYLGAVAAHGADMKLQAFRLVPAAAVSEDR